MGKTKTKLIDKEDKKEITEVAEKKSKEGTERKTAEREPKLRGKKYQDAKAKIDQSKLYPPEKAVGLVKETSISRFDGSIELHLLIKRGNFSTKVALPYSTGKIRKVQIADDKTIEKIKNGKIDFDILLATAEMMPKLVPLARILGPKGLMPNPKKGTIIKSAKEADKFKGNSMELTTEKKAPVIHTLVGKVSQSDKELKENLEAILDAVSKKQIIKAYLCASMGPSVKVKIVN